MGHSGTLDSCALCGRQIEPFGKMRHRFFAEDLQGDEICLDCARKVAPSQVSMAELMEHGRPRARSHEPES
jgi:recombinational DNA repair protein (RecF pathway)